MKKRASLLVRHGRLAFARCPWHPFLRLVFSAEIKWNPYYIAPLTLPSLIYGERVSEKIILMDGLMKMVRFGRKVLSGILYYLFLGD